MPHWKKRGRIFHLGPSPERGTTHAQVPTVFVRPDRVRVYFAARNTEKKSYPAFVDLARDNLTKVLAVQERPIMEYGKAGTFDDAGIMPGCVVDKGDCLWMYYTGWNQRVSVPYHNTTGLAASHDDGETFVQMFEGPILDRTPLEPSLAVTPAILSDGDRWQMWYVSGLGWENIEGKYEPVYVIKYASSRDGIHWDRPNILCVNQAHPLEAFSHPWVIKHEKQYHMWYCFRDSRDYRDGKGSYRMGYARSLDGMKWERDDDAAGIDLSDEGWDSTMICYPSVVEIDGSIYMFYNGNGFGQSGIGLAILESW